MNKPIFIKLGGSVLTDKNQPESLDTDVLNDIIQTIKRFQTTDQETPILLGHGGGSFGHYWAQRYNTAHGLKTPEDRWGMVLVADAMARLARLVTQACLEHELPAMSVQPSATATAHGQHIHSIETNPIEHMLQTGIIPIVYGDVLIDSKQGCTIASTETIFAALAPKLQPQRIILVGEQAVYTADPRQNPAAEPIAQISQANYQKIIEYLGESHGIDVTGGMRSKVEHMWQLAHLAPGLEIVICGPSVLYEALTKQALPLGTIVAP